MKHVSRLSALFLALHALGCGGASGPPLYDVRGKLSWDDGSAIPNATVNFMPSAKGIPTSAARTNDSGDFVLTTSSGQLGAAAGKFKVVVLGPRPEAKTPEQMTDAYKNPGKAAPTPAGDVIPAEYTSADKTPIEIEITGAKKDLAITIVKGK